MNGKFLLESERKYLVGELQPGGAYERKLRSNIIKKALKLIEAMPDFALILKSEKLPERLKDKLLSWNNYQLKILPFAQALYLSIYPRVHREEDEVRALQDSLEAAGIPYQPKRLRLDENYRLEKMMAVAKWIREHEPAWMGMEIEDPSVRAHIGLMVYDEVWRKFKKAVDQNFISLRQGINEALEQWALRKLKTANAFTNEDKG